MNQRSIWLRFKPRRRGLGGLVPCQRRRPDRHGRGVFCVAAGPLHAVPLPLERTGWRCCGAVQDGTMFPGPSLTLSEEGWNSMNRKEGHLNVYHQTPVQVITVQGEAVEAITYVVQPALQHSELVAPIECVRRCADSRRACETEITNWTFEIFTEHLDAKSTIDHVFVYGTLMKGNERWPRMRPWSTEGPVIGSVRGGCIIWGTTRGCALTREVLFTGRCTAARTSTGPWRNSTPWRALTRSNRAQASTFVCRCGLTPKRNSLGGRTSSISFHHQPFHWTTGTGWRDQSSSSSTAP